MKLFDYQEKWVDIIEKYFNETPLLFKPKGNLFLDMGLGKTYTSLEIAKRMQPKKLLIICPKSLITMWEYAIDKFFYGRYSRFDSIHGFLACSINNTAIIIKNYESFLSIDYDIQTDLVILDEAHKVKNYKGKMHKIIAKHVKAKRALCLTGTAITRDFMDLFGILTCIGPQTWNGLTAAQFKSRYIINGGSYRTFELMSLIKPYTIMGSIQEYIDMPDEENVVIPVDLEQTQYWQLDLIYASKEKALARIAAAQQVTSGIEFNYGKRAACEDLLKDIFDDGEKAVLFVKFTNEYEYFMEKYKDIAVGINGAVKDRFSQEQEFENNPKIKLFVGNLQTASLGLTLVKAHKCIFYSETDNWADMIQAQRRIYRIGQDYPCTYYHLIARDSVDEVIYNSNLNKSNLIEDFKKIYGGE